MTDLRRVDIGPAGYYLPGPCCAQRQRIVQAQRTSADEERQKTLVDEVGMIRGLGYVGEEDMEEDGD